MKSGKKKNLVIVLNQFFAHLAESQQSLCYGVVFVVRLSVHLLVFFPVYAIKSTFLLGFL